MGLVLYDDGDLTYERMTDDNVREALRVLRKTFLLDENLCRAVELHTNENAMAEMEMFAFDSAKGGASVVAVDKKTKSIVAVLFNKIHIKSNVNDKFEHGPVYKEPQMLAILNVINGVNDDCNFFERYGPNSIMEMFMLGTLADFRRRGIGQILMEVSIRLWEEINSGRNALLPLDNRKLAPALRPTVIYAICTASMPQKVLENMGFNSAAIVDFDKLSYDGKTFDENTDSTASTIAYYKIWGDRGFKSVL